MFKAEDHEHHRERVRAELDLAYRADSTAAANAHLRLSALHMRRLAEIDGTAEPVLHAALDPS
jgi:hypothetical protein